MRKKYKLTEDQQQIVLTLLQKQVNVFEHNKKNKDGSINFGLELINIQLKHIIEIISRQPIIKFSPDVWQIIYELEQEEITREIKKENK